MQNQNPMPATEGKRSFGPLAGVIIIVILLILGAIYMWGGDDSAKNEASDEVSTIESELSADQSADVDLSELESI